MPPSWKNYRKRILHKNEDYSLEEIQKHIRIEEESICRDKLVEGSNEETSKANATSKVPNKNKGKTKKSDTLGPKSKPNQFKGGKGPCFVCGKLGHYAKDCKHRKDLKGPKVNAIEEDIIATLSEVNSVQGKVKGWWYDTCATVHVTYDKSLFKTFEESKGNHEIQMGNEVKSKVLGKGTIDVFFTSGKKVTLVNVLYVPDMNRNLISGDLLGKPGIKAVYESGKLILTKSNVFLGKGYSCEGMVKLCTNDVTFNVNNNKASSSTYMIEHDSLFLWHLRLAHIGFSTMKRVKKCGMIDCDIRNYGKCETCVKAKMIKKPFPNVVRNSKLLDLIHYDLCELNGILTRGGKRYFITFIDDYSRYTYVYLLKQKDEAFGAFKIFKAEVENQLNIKIKVLRSDRGGEYFSNEFTHFCEENGIIHESSAPHTPQQNGVAERKNRTFLEMINSMIVYSKLNNNLWGEALLTACHILNRIPMKKNDMSPYELWRGRKPNIGYFKVWGCLAYCKKTEPNRTKLGSRAIKCAFVGYANNSKAYRLLDVESNVVIESREVEFFENKLYGDNSQSSTPLGENILYENNSQASTSKRGSQEENTTKVVEQPIEPRRGQRVRKEKSLNNDEIDSQLISFYAVEGTREEVIRKIPLILLIEDDPKTFLEAMQSRDSAFWREAVDDEMDSILSNNTYDIVDLPQGCKAIGCKWIFRKKYHTDGSIQTFKARLVAKGFRQKEGIDYFDTYAPVARTTTIRVLFALASLHNLYVHQMDVKTAFLNGDLDEEVYMEQPEGFVLPNNEHKVCKLKKSIYGLKQAPKQWHVKFDNAILSNGFRHNNGDKCLYSKTCKNYVIIVCLYVDDMLILSDDMKGIEETKRFLSSTFKMKDLGEVDTILGIKVTRHSGGFALGQAHYIEKVLNKFSHLKAKEANTPFDHSKPLVKHSGRAVAQLEYASVIGSFMYAAQCTRPDISFAVSKLSRFTINPSVDHWKAIGRVLGYLKKTKNLCLHYSKFPSILEGYTDASWIANLGDNLSTTGWVFTLGGGAVSWGSKKQTCISHSTMEAEFIALAATGKEAEWLRDLLIEIPIIKEDVSTISIHCDSQATLARAYSGVYNGKSRHISLRHGYVSELIQRGVISISYVRSSENLADPFTKPLTRDLVEKTSKGMGLKLPKSVHN